MCWSGQVHVCWSGDGSEVSSRRPRPGTSNGSFHDTRARRAQVQNTSVALLKQQEKVLLPQVKQIYQQRVVQSLSLKEAVAGVP